MFFFVRMADDLVKIRSKDLVGGRIIWFSGGTEGGSVVP